MIVNSNTEELETVVEVSNVCAQLALKCLYLARTSRVDILWSVNFFGKVSNKMEQS